MKKRSIIKTIICIIFSVLLVSTTAIAVTPISTDDIILSIPVDRSITFYNNQAESVGLYNQLLNGFSEESASILRTADSQTDENVYPDYFGGAYINDATGGLVVLTTQNTNFAQNKIRNFTDNNSLIEIRACSVSYNEIMSTIDELTDNLDYFAANGVIIDIIADDIMNNCVNVYVVDLTEDKEDFIAAFAECNFIRFFEAESGSVCYESLGGGNQIVSSINGGASTIGFAAQKGTKKGYVIAGHAGNLYGERFFYNETEIGSVIQTAYYNNTIADAAFVEANSNFEPDYVLSNNGKVLSGYDSENIPINLSVWMLGAKSSLQSGKILSTNASIINGDITVKEMCITSCFAQEGDSGGPILLFEGNMNGSTYTIMGILGGGVGSNTYFSTYRNIKNILKVTCIKW